MTKSKFSKEEQIANRKRYKKEYNKKWHEANYENRRGKMTDEEKQIRNVQRLTYYHEVIRKNLNYYLWQKAKGRAKRGNLEFTIDVEDVVIPEMCPILEIPLIPSYGKHATANSPSIDRIDNTKGYVKGNVGVISYRANKIKGTLTLKQVKNLVSHMELSVYGLQEQKEVDDYGLQPEM